MVVLDLSSVLFIVCLFVRLMFLVGSESSVELLLERRKIIWLFLFRLLISFSM